MGHSQRVPFRLVGQLEGYILGESGKVAYLRLRTGQESHTIKLNQSSRVDLLRGVVEERLQRDSWVEVTGFQKFSQKGLSKRLKAERIVPMQGEAAVVGQTALLPVILPSPLQTDPTQTKILVCQKSACCKRGSAHLQAVIETTLRDRGLEGVACVKAVGCLKQCSKGPNIVIGKTSYRNVSAKEVACLLARHFQPSACPETAVA